LDEATRDKRLPLCRNKKKNNYYRFDIYCFVFLCLKLSLWWEKYRSPTMSHVPIVNFSPFLDPQSSPEARRATALEIDKACREIGFFYLSSHGIDEELRSAMLSRAKTFFEGSDGRRKEVHIHQARWSWRG
jgi:hypothetical protein